MQIGYHVRTGGGMFTGIFDGSGKTSLPGGIRLTLLYDLDARTGIARRRLEVHNASADTVRLMCAHITYMLPIVHPHLSYFTSDWGSEYNPVEADVTYPISFGTFSGRSSKGCCPYFTVASMGIDQKLFGLSVGWSGNWQAHVSRDANGCLVRAGLAEDGFFHDLLPDASFENIDLYDGFLSKGDSEQLSFLFRGYYRDQVMLLDKAAPHLPVCWNSWWPYEDKWINEDVFLDNARVAKELGCTNTLLDAGWFGPSEVPDELGDMPWFLKRGDWEMENTALFPSGLASLGSNTRDAGLPFGIWCEIEAAGKEAALKTSRPELIAVQNGQQLDYVCMGNPKSVDWALSVFRRLIEDYGATWIKIDFNLDPARCDCTAHGHGEGDGLYAHYKGLYAFMDEARRRWPHVLLENCSSGGLRIDYGIMRHCHLLFLSDPDYTRHHLQCFWGALSHIHPAACYHFTQSETVCHHNYAWDESGKRYAQLQPIREDTALAQLDFMTRACMTGPMALSQKLPELPKWALTRLHEHIAYHKAISGDFILRGDLYRLTGQPRSEMGLGESWCAFQLMHDGDAILFAYKMPEGPNQKTLLLRGLKKESLYEVRDMDTGVVLRQTGYALMTRGVIFTAPEDAPEWSAILQLKAVNA